MKRIILSILLIVLLISCKGPSDNATEEEKDNINQTECTFSSDCDEGYTCSNSGRCILDEDALPLPPSECNVPNADPAGIYVAVDGSDASGNGSLSAPYATITHALDNAEDGDTILVRPGSYDGRVRIRGTFIQGVTVRSEEPYLARLHNDGTVITAYTHANGCSGIAIEGFEISHTGTGSAPLVVHLDGNGTGAVSHITLRNNILHDSYNNDILKINNGISDITVERNLFYNQSGSDEHIDINSAANILVQDNIFMNDFAGSGRTNSNDTSSYVVIKDSNGDEDRYIGSHDIILRRNIFLNWEGSSGSNFVLLGEDGQNFYEAYDITIENNLMIGNSANVMRAPLGIKGGRNILFRNNTIVGDLPALAFAMRFNREGDNPVNRGIDMYNNIWSDPTGTMGATATGQPNDFSDTSSGDVMEFALYNNLYWNGGNGIPSDSNETINLTNDSAAITADPGFTEHSALVMPRWNATTQLFADGTASICDAFNQLADSYGTPESGSPVINRADTDQVAYDDLLGNPRGSNPDIGAIEIQ